MKDDKIRSIGLYQPFGSLMLPEYNKLETRWVREGRVPSFPLGKYLIYTTKRGCNMEQMYDWCGEEGAKLMFTTMENESTVHYNGYALGVAELVDKWVLKPEDQNTYIKFIGRKVEIIEGKEVVKIQWALKFASVERIKPFRWKHGKQGVGIVPVEEIKNIEVLTLGETIK
jgi:hypothetical protein